MSPSDDAVVEALGKLSEALETTERARGALYAFHQLTGEADFALDGAIRGLRGSGHEDVAARIERELVGKDVIEGRWTFQIVEDYDDGYYATFRGLERELREELGVERHAYEARLKRERQGG